MSKIALFRRNSIVQGLLILLFFLPNKLVATTKDSTQIEELKKKVSLFETDNKILSERIGSISTANDKILSASYFLIGSVIALLTIVTFWNGFQNWLTNTRRLEEISLNVRAISKNDINEQIEQLKKLFQTKNNAVSMEEFQQLKNKFPFLERDYLELKIRFIKSLLVFSTFHDTSKDANFEHSRLEEWLIESYRLYEIKGFFG
ncbi:hypothetical protein GO755_29570 [Spirosoma sp. HMF4905]|uniref:Uncharacterized protein n=1 Tax=Spirosoma arboris TaxID=2682092 RepID=A0A7K1SK88_9BACT|nr:hypothetical protein [Spirosoma arboris]MVM34217.1 hypothetical protein [Spirosoma arboris]